MSSNDTRIDVKACHGANYSVSNMNLSLHDTNLSLSNDSLSLGDRHSQAIKNDPNSKVLFSDVTPVITHFFIKQAVATDDNKRYYRVLSKLNSDMPSRTPLAFFVPDNSAASQAVTIYSSTALRAHLSASRGQTIISIANHLLTDYDGLTLQNKIAVRRICRAVSVKTESKTRHPIPLLYSVAHTHNLTGGYHA